MSTTFKVGDIAEFTENYMEHKVGERFTVTAVDTAYGEALSKQLVQGRKPNLFSGVYSHRLKLVATEYKGGDRVQVTIPDGNTDTYGGSYFVTGGGSVLGVDEDGGRTLLQVKADTKHPLRGGRNGWWVDTKFVTPLAEELPFEVGSRVRAKAGYLGVASEGIVTRLYGDFGGDIEIAWETGKALAGLTLGARRRGLEVIASPIVERPKAIPATETKPQVGDTIVAFWEAGGVETRRKGVIASFDWDGTAVTAEGEYITWDDSENEAAEDSVFIVERAPKTEPVKENPFAEAKVGSLATYGDAGVKYLKKNYNAWSPISENGDVAGHSNSDYDMNDNGTVRITYNI